MSWLRKQTLCKLPWPFFFHRPKMVQVLDSQTRKLLCRDCLTYFAMSDRYQAVLPWDEDIERLYCDLYGLPRTNK